MSKTSQVESAAAKAAAARSALYNTMRQAHANGASLRDLAKASGLSHETVRRIVRS